MHMFSLAFLYIYSEVKKVLKDMNENLELQERKLFTSYCDDRLFFSVIFKSKIAKHLQVHASRM